MRKKGKEKNHFDMIYQAAVQQDENLLPEEPYEIDTWQQNFNQLSAAAKLASEGNNKAVDWLLERGAYIGYIAFGYALSGYKKEAFDCIKNHKANINLVAKGFAMGAYKAEAFLCVEKRGADITEVAVGFALGGHVNHALACVEERGAGMYNIGRAFLLGGYVEQALKCFDTLDDNCNSLVAFTLARRGCIKQAWRYADKRDVPINKVARGFALGGYVEQALKCIDEWGADSTIVAVCFALGAYVEQALACVNSRGADIIPVVDRLILRRYFKTEKELLSVLSRLSFSDNRKKLIETLKNKGVNVSPSTFGKWQAAEKLCNTYGFTFKQALLSINLYEKSPIIASGTQEKTITPSLLSFLARYMMYGSDDCLLPKELLNYVFQLAADKISVEDLKILGFLTAHLVLLSQLPESAAAVKTAILATTDFKSLASVVHQQKDSALSENKVLLLWDKRLSGYRNNQQEEKNEKKAETNSVLFAGA